MRLVYSQIASNTRRSIIFIGLFFFIWLAIGAAGGFIFTAIAHPSANAETDRKFHLQSTSTQYALYPHSSSTPLC